MRYYNNNDLNNLSDNDTELKAIYDKLKKFYEEDRAKESAESIALARDFINNTQAYFPQKEWREIDDLRKKARQYTGYDEVMSVKLKDPSIKAPLTSLLIFFGFFSIDRFYIKDYATAFLRLFINIALLLVAIFNPAFAWLLLIPVFWQLTEFFAVPRRIRKINAETMRKHCRAIIAKHDLTCANKSILT